MQHTANMFGVGKPIYLLFVVFFMLADVRKTDAVELTFNLPDRGKNCFHEDIAANQTVNIEYQVSAGGQLDIDAELRDPRGQIIFSKQRSSFDSHHFTSQLNGTYQICFSNEFSTFTHKVVYMDFQVGLEPPLPGIGAHATVLTKMETSAQAIHVSLNDILDAQTHHRLREVQGRMRAEDMNERVLIWSLTETIVMVVISVGQVLILRNFFADRKPSQMRYARL